MQHKLATWAAADQTRRFDRLLRLVTDRNWLAEAARIVLASKGASTIRAATKISDRLALALLGTLDKPNAGKAQQSIQQLEAEDNQEAAA